VTTSHTPRLSLAVVALLVAAITGCSKGGPSTLDPSAIDPGPSPGTDPGTTPPPPPADVADVRAFGATGDGVTDDTAAFQAAAATGKVVFVPQTSAHYKITATIHVSNSIRGDGSLPEIQFHGTTGQESSTMIAVVNYDGPGLTVSGLHLDGGWDQSSANGEWAHNVMLKGSRNVTIEDNVLERAEGDNVFLGGEWNPNPSRNIVIRNNQLLTPRRCAVALIWADGVTITGNTIQKPSSYVTAIDAEPNPNGYETVWNVTISNNHFDTAAGAVMLYNMPANAPAGGIGGNISITGNRGNAAFFFTQVNGGSGWSNISRSDNF
jgi:polygalacturonase